MTVSPAKTAASTWPKATRSDPSLRSEQRALAQLTRVERRMRVAPRMLIRDEALERRDLIRWRARLHELAHRFIELGIRERGAPIVAAQIEDVRREPAGDAKLLVAVCVG